MRRLMILAALAAGLACPAKAAERVCHGQAKGPAGEVKVDLTSDGDRIVGGSVGWSPRVDPSSSPGAGLYLSRQYEDAEAGRLGPFDGLAAGTAVAMDPPPQADRALISVSTNTVRPIGKEWPMFAQAMAERKAGRRPVGLPADARGAVFFGVVPFNREDVGAAPLLDSLATARTVIAAATDIEGRTLISRGLFWVDDRAGFETLERDAYRQAREAAKAPTQLCTPAAPARR